MTQQPEVTTVPINTRTYSVPGEVVGAVVAAAQSGDYAPDHWNLDLAHRIVSGRQLSVEDIVLIASASTDDGGYQLRGADSGVEWANRVLSGIQRDIDAEYDRTTSRWGYDPDEYDYLGLAQNDEDTITGIVRKPGNDTSLDSAELLTNDGWKRVEFSFLDEDHDVRGVSLDRDLFAFSAKALIDDGVDGVVLSYADPVAFLPDVPVLASGLIPGLPGTGGHVYAIVDSTDTSAVMDIILITPPYGDQNAQIFRRNAGRWQLSPELYDTFMSASPPPIVELTGETMDQIISQVDANSANQVTNEEDGTAEIADPQAVSSINTTPIKTKAGATKSMFPPGGPSGGGPFGHASPNKRERKDPNHAQPGKAKPPENRGFRTPEDSEEGPGTRPPVTASIMGDLRSAEAQARSRRDEIVKTSRDFYATDEGFSSGFSLVAAIQSAELDYRRETFEARRDALLAAAGETARLRAREAEIERFILPIVAASKSTNKPFVHNKPGQIKAAALRRYWTTGKGGTLKIRWGTSGDWTRCERQLRRYLGPRAKGFCALRHREMVGMWTGDKAHRKGK